MGRLTVHARLSTLLKLAAWGCVIALVLLSEWPGRELVRTDIAKLGYGKQLEHVIAYFGATTIIGLAYQARLSRLTLVLVLVPFAALLEIGQLYVPDRGASVIDFAASTTGIVAAALLLPLGWRVLTWVLLSPAPAAQNRKRQAG